MRICFVFCNSHYLYCFYRYRSYRYALGRHNETSLNTINNIKRGLIVLFFISTKMLSLVNWLEDHMMTCYYKQVSGIDCPGCGMQRSFIELLKGNFFESIKLYPALFAVIITLGIT